MTVNAACDCSACWCGTCVRWSKYSTPRLTRGYSRSERVRNVWGINRVLLRILICFRAILLDLTSRIERLHVCYYCADVGSVLAYFYSKYNRARQSTGRSGQVIDSVCMSQFLWHDCRPISCSHSTVAVAAPARLRLVARCALVRNSLQISCLQWVMTRYHTLDIMLEIGARN